jgi:hypothetical protein
VLAIQLVACADPASLVQLAGRRGVRSAFH